MAAAVAKGTYDAVKAGAATTERQDAFTKAAKAVSSGNEAISDRALSFDDLLKNSTSELFVDIASHAFCSSRTGEAERPRDEDFRRSGDVFLEGIRVRRVRGSDREAHRHKLRASVTLALPPDRRGRAGGTADRLQGFLCGIRCWHHQAAERGPRGARDRL